MSFVFSIKDTYRAAVEAASGGRNTVLYDDLGNPSIMVVVPRLNLSDVIAGAPAEPHPAFKVNGQVKSEIFISKYENIIYNGRAYSLPHQDPAQSINFDTARNACFAKGQGWHLMTNAEWAAIALWCKKNSFFPRGNNNYLADSGAAHERGVKATTGGDYRARTGSGPASWSHDGTPDGIFDMNGNVWEWVDGLKLVDGKIYVHPDNNFGVGNAYRDVTGWIDTGAYFDCTVAGDATQTSHEIGDPILSPDRTNPMYTTDPSSDAEYGYSHVPFESLTAETGFTVPDVLKWLAIAPADAASHGGDGLWVRNYGERLPLRGGGWVSGANAGVFTLALSHARSYVDWLVGFRAAYIPV